MLNDANKVVSIRVADLFGKPVDVAVSLDSLTDSTGKKVADVQLLQAVLGTDKYVMFIMTFYGFFCTIHQYIPFVSFMI